MFETFSKYMCMGQQIDGEESPRSSVESLDKTNPYEFEPEYKYSGILFCYDKDLWRSKSGDDFKANGLGDVETYPPREPTQ